MSYWLFEGLLNWETAKKDLLALNEDNILCDDCKKKVASPHLVRHPIIRSYLRIFMLIIVMTILIKIMQKML